ncbi:hypothetical protein KIW84_MT0017 (mitochondrion) [Lathyrus oleraceus]|nr:hypothetical protein KIW84_MT0017 [Pisum sativum]
MPNLPAAPLTKKGADALHGPLPFCCCQRFPGPRYKGQATKAAIPIGLRAERGEGPAIKSYHRGRKSVFPSDNTHRRRKKGYFNLGNSRGSPLEAFAGILLLCLRLYWNKAKKEAEWRKDKGGLAWRKGCWFGGRLAGGVLILCDNTTERVALLGGQLCDNTTEKAALSFNMLWSQRPYEIVMSFTRSKPGPRAVRKIGRNLSGTTHPTLPPIGGRPFYSRPKRNCSDLE